MTCRSYKTILVHAGPDDGAGGRIRLAAALARAADAHLVGAATTGISRFMPPAAIAAGGHVLVARCADLRQAAADALRQFDAIVKAEGLARAEARLVDDDVAAGLALQARYADLVVVGRPEHGRVDPLRPTDLPDTLLLECARPVLVLPHARDAPAVDGTVLVAWDGGVAATHALDAALPLLRLAGRVCVLRFGPPEAASADEGTQLAAWLARHGITARVEHHGSVRHAGDEIIDAARAAGAGLLVLGAYGHGRWREALSHGVTATVLRAAGLPALLAH